MTYLMEMGCIFHSVLIGVALGVTTGQQAAIALLIALTFHQLLEGMALAAMITVAGFGAAKSIAMVAAYAITAPIGVAVGIAVSATYDETSVAAAGAQGVINGVSAGMLLYVALVTQMGEEFGHASLQRRTPTSLRIAQYGAMLAGAGLMAMLAIWA
jgi:zinc transporter 1/2/3